MRANQLRRMASRIAAAVAEMNEAQRRMTLLRCAQDRYLTRSDLAPDTYAEFMARTSGPLLSEPSATDRTPPGATRPR